MRQTQLFSKTTKDISAEEVSLNASLLIRAGFVDKLTAGVYSYLPLGLIVLRKIEAIVRNEMNAAGGQEVLMAALTPKENWQQTNRWDNFDALYRLVGHDGKEYALGATHEEVVTPLVQRYVKSYRDLPVSVYQIQTKFRNEKRAKAGLLRGREFLMKDMYSFHRDQADLDAYYSKMLLVYKNIYARLGLGELTYTTYALGGSFSKYSHEFQTICESGEDVIYICSNCKMAYNKELIEIDGQVCVECKNETFDQKKAIEVGNIFKLQDKFSAPFKFNFQDSDEKEKAVLMGCYGIGISRLMGTVVEVYNDKSGIVWPMAIAPAQVHLILLGTSQEVLNSAEELYQELQKQGIEVIFDDRQESAGSKLKDADLIGIPLRLIISEKTMAQNSVEAKMRAESEAQMIERGKVVEYIKSKI